MGTGLVVEVSREEWSPVKFLDRARGSRPRTTTSNRAPSSSLLPKGHADKRYGDADGVGAADHRGGRSAPP